jgi:hypothetical protein
MADTKISALTAATTLADTDELVIASAGASKKITGATLKAAPYTIFDAKGDILAASADNTAARLAVGTNGQVLTADSAAAAGVKWATPSAGGGGAWTLLSTTTLGSAAVFDVSSISGSYNDLILVLIARASAAGASDGLWMKVNNDSGSNYHQQLLRSVGSTASAASTYGTGPLQWSAVPGGGAPANEFCQFECTIFGYASTTWIKGMHATLAYAGAFSGTNFQVDRLSAYWNSTAAINRVAFATSNGAVGNGTFVTGSQLRIYGRL